jgi:hypothetical protein
VEVLPQTSSGQPVEPAAWHAVGALFAESGALPSIEAVTGTAPNCSRSAAAWAIDTYASYHELLDESVAERDAHAVVVNAARQVAYLDAFADEQRSLVHPDGSPCEDGCSPAPAARAEITIVLRPGTHGGVPGYVASVEGGPQDLLWRATPEAARVDGEAYARASYERTPGGWRTRRLLETWDPAAAGGGSS